MQEGDSGGDASHLQQRLPFTTPKRAEQPRHHSPGGLSVLWDEGNFVLWLQQKGIREDP